MKAVVLKKQRTLKIEDIPVPELKQDEVMVKVEACGICGSDIRYFEGENPWALHTLGIEKENPANIILGHEFAGRVVETGGPAFKGLKGKRVVVSPYRSCGMCRFCRMGKYNLCIKTVHLGHGAGWGNREYYPGGMAEFCQVWADKAYILPDNISYEEATLLDIVGVAIHALGVSEISPGSDVVILGTGPLGLSLVQVSKIWGAKRVFCSDIYDRPLEIALKTGADESVNVKKEDLVKFILKKTDKAGANVVFDTVGTEETAKQSLQILSAGGTLVNMAVNTNVISFKLLELAGERTIKSSSNYFFHDFQTAIDLAEAGKLKLKPLITHRFPLKEINKAFKILLDKERYNAIKVVITRYGRGKECKEG